MKEMRLLGITLQKLAEDNNIGSEKMQKVLGCSPEQLLAIYEGRFFPSFGDLQNLAKLFKVSVEDLLKGDECYYNANVVHCMGDFEDKNNREEILDIIENYLVLRDAVAE